MAGLVLLAIALAGCVERKLTVVTVPAGADVFLDGRHIGKSPVTVPFTFYGTREVVVRKPGYRTQRHLETMTPPYFQDPPYDLYYETLTRDLYRDERAFRYVMSPLSEADRSRARVEQKVAEAKEMRLR